MLAAADTLQRSLPVWSALSVISALLVIAGCALLTEALFHLPVRKKPLPWVLFGVLNLVCGALDPLLLRTGSEGFTLLWSAVDLLLPFASMALIFYGKALWKAMLAVAGYSFVEALTFTILLTCFGFDYTDRNDALELLVGVPVNLVFFGVTLFLCIRSVRRRTGVLGLTRTGVILYLLIVLSFSVFVTTLLIIGPAIYETKHFEFSLLLLNIPTISATVTFAAVRFLRMRNESENYRRQLQMQIAQFERMEQAMEEIRIFRHDFPKKMRPLVASLDADRPEEAKQIAEQFSDFAARVGDRFHTGNYRLDTVLSFEQQLADRDKIRIDVPFDTVFPAEGIDPDDIYTIFPNALDNAIEACRKLPEAERTVTFRSRMDGQAVFVTIRNPHAGEIRMKNGLPQTGKAEKAAHGWGLRSIKKAAAKYGEDNVTFLIEDGTFELRLFLNYRAAGEIGPASP
ncbi:MAG: GHKL domain-containing protein [Clostridia bacterium]|nr:GHKL domain-containing protein [Clostridia bacterium]